jgi:hypothetical protein
MSRLREGEIVSCGKPIEITYPDEGKEWLLGCFDLPDLPRNAIGTYVPAVLKGVVDDDGMYRIECRHAYDGFPADPYHVRGGYTTAEPHLFTHHERVLAVNEVHRACFTGHPVRFLDEYQIKARAGSGGRPGGSGFGAWLDCLFECGGLFGHYGSAESVYDAIDAYVRTFVPKDARQRPLAVPERTNFAAARSYGKAQREASGQCTWWAHPADAVAVINQTPN